MGCVGLVFLIHPFAGIVGWLLLGFLLVFGEPRMPTGRLWVMVAGTGLYALIVAAWLLSMYLQDHTAPHRFLEHAAGKSTGAGVVVHNGYGVALRQLFDPAFPASAALAVSLLVAALVVTGYAFRAAARPSLLLQCALLLIVLLIFPFAVFPAQTNYLGLARALLVAVLLIGGFPLAGALRGSAAPFSFILIGFIFLAPWVGLEILQNFEARGSYYHEQEQARRVRTFFAQQGVRNPALLGDAGHYFVYKPYFPDLYNRNYVEPGDATGQVQGLIVCYSGSRAFSRAQLRPGRRTPATLVEADRRRRRRCSRDPLWELHHAPQLDLDVRCVCGDETSHQCQKMRSPAVAERLTFTGEAIAASRLKSKSR